MLSQWKNAELLPNMYKASIMSDKQIVEIYWEHDTDPNNLILETSEFDEEVGPMLWS